MCGRGSDSTNLPEPSDPFDERFVYRLTDEGKQALAVCERANGKPAFTKTRCTPAVAQALDAEARRESKRQRRKEARQRGARLGTVSAMSATARPNTPPTPRPVMNRKSVKSKGVRLKKVSPVNAE